MARYKEDAEKAEDAFQTVLNENSNSSSYHEENNLGNHPPSLNEDDSIDLQAEQQNLDHQRNRTLHQRRVSCGLCNILRRRLSATSNDKQYPIREFEGYDMGIENRCICGQIDKCWTFVDDGSFSDTLAEAEIMEVVSDSETEFYPDSQSRKDSMGDIYDILKSMQLQLSEVHEKWRKDIFFLHETERENKDLRERLSKQETLISNFKSTIDCANTREKYLINQCDSLRAEVMAFENKTGRKINTANHEDRNNLADNYSTIITNGFVADGFRRRLYHHDKSCQVDTKSFEDTNVDPVPRGKESLCSGFPTKEGEPSLLVVRKISIDNQPQFIPERKQRIADRRERSGKCRSWMSCFFTRGASDDL